MSIAMSNDLERLDKENRWSELPPINLSETRNALAVKMPGFRICIYMNGTNTELATATPLGRIFQ